MLPDRLRSSSLKALPLALVALAAALPYAGVLDTPFVFDDVKLVRDNRHLAAAYENPSLAFAAFDETERRWDDEELRPNYRPLRFLSYLLDYAATRRFHGDFEPANLPVFFFHLSNVIFHVLNALLVAAIARSIARSLGTPDDSARFAGLAAGLVFALHPLATEAVTYISGRRDVLSTCLFLLALALHLRAPSGRVSAVLAVIGVPVCLHLSLLSKEMAVTLPALLLVIDVALRARRTASRVLVHVLSWAVVIYRLSVIDQTPGLVEAVEPRSVLDIGTQACRYIARYLGLALFPHPQSIDYSFDAIPESSGLLAPSTNIPAVLLVIALAACGVVLVLSGRPAGRWVGLGILWFIGCLVPVLQIVPAAEKFAERFAYLPLIGIVIAAACGAALLRRSRPALAAAALCLVCAVFLAATVRRNSEWESPLALWTSAVKAQPQAARARFARGSSLKEAGMLRESAEELTRALEIFSRKPDVPLHQGYILQALTIRGGVYALLAGEEPSVLEKAIADYQRVLASRDIDGTAIGSSPKHAAVRLDLGGFLLRKGELDASAAEYRRLIELGEPRTIVSAAHYYLGKIAFLAQDLSGARSSMERAIESMPEGDPSRVRVAIELVDLLIDAKELDHASDVVLRARSWATRGKEPLYLRLREAKILDRRGDLKGCMTVLEEILREDPSWAPALLTLAGIEAARGEFDRAAARYGAVLRANPRDPEALRGIEDVRVRRQLASGGGAPGTPAGGETLSLDALEKRAGGHLEKGEMFAAKEVFVELLSRARAAGDAGHQANALVELGRIAERLGKIDDAETFFREALAANPSAAAPHRYLGDLLLRRKGDRDGARAEYERYLEALPEGSKADPLVHVNMASLVARSDPHSAIDHAKKAIALGYDAPGVWRALGHHYAEIGAWKESLEAFNRYLETPVSGDEAERESTRAFVKETVLPRVLDP